MLMQRKHNLNLNYNLMGFDTIEINLVKNSITINWAVSLIKTLVKLINNLQTLS